MFPFFGGLLFPFSLSADAVLKHFEDFHEDQFDFHSYCIRKVTLRAYTDVLHWEDQLWGQPYYGEAAEGIIKIYLHLYDNPNIAAEHAEPDYASMSAADRKKAKALARKKKKVAEKKSTDDAEQKKGKEADVAADDGKKKKPPPPPPPEVIDEDPEGQMLFKKDPLDEAKNYSAILSKNAVTRLSTWLLQYDVSCRRGKGLMSLQALFKAKALEPDSSEVFSRIVDFGIKYDSFMGSNEVVNAVFRAEVPALLENKDLVGFVLAAAETISPLSSLPMRVEVAKALVKISKASVAEAATLIVDGGLSGYGVSVVNCRMALDELTALGPDALNARLKWVSAVNAHFPLLKDFK